jgi:hypothetical protein
MIRIRLLMKQARDIILQGLRIFFGVPFPCRNNGNRAPKRSDPRGGMREVRNVLTGSILFLVSILLSSALSVVSCSRPPRGAFPYDVGVTDPRDNPASLAPLRGHPVVFATYVASMPDCRKRIERIVALSDAFRGADVRFVAVDIEPGEPGMFPDTLPNDRGNVLFLKDRNNEVKRALKIDITPTTFLVTAGGKIRDRIESVYTWDAPDFRHRVESLAGGR